MSEVVVRNVFRDATEGGAADAAAGSKRGSTTAAAAPDGKAKSQSNAVFAMRACNFCNGLCLATFAIVVFLLPEGSLVPSFSTITLSAYTCFLGLLMCCVEINMTLLNDTVRRNCGFMFSYLGRAVFVFFSGTMALALVTPDSSVQYLYVIGGLTCLNAFWNLYVVLTNPSFSQNVLADPSTSSASAEQEVGAYLAAHPELAARAVGSLTSSGTLPGGAVSANAMRAAMPSADRASRVASMANPFMTAQVTASAYDTPVSVSVPSHGAMPHPDYARQSLPLGYNGATGAMSATAAATAPRAPMQRAESENPFR